MARPSWDEYFSKQAELVSTRSTCPRAHVGVVITQDNHIISTGYNGSAPDTEHCIDSSCLVEDGHCQRAIHAEVNAVAEIIKLGKTLDVSKARLYMWDTNKRKLPCRECWKVLSALGFTAEQIIPSG